MHLGGWLSGYITIKYRQCIVATTAVFNGFIAHSSDKLYGDGITYGA